jgi:hypothetical protein
LNNYKNSQKIKTKILNCKTIGELEDLYFSLEENNNKA